MISGSIEGMKVEPIEFADGLDMKYWRKSVVDGTVISLSNWKGDVIN